MNIKIDQEVFKLKDDRVNALLRGKITITGFIHTLRQGDFLILIKDTVYALTQAQFYAAQQTKKLKPLSFSVFKDILAQDISIFKPEDKKFVQEIKTAKNSCSSCHYNKNKNKLYNIVINYPQLIKKYNLDSTLSPIQNIKYPEISQAIEPKVSKLFKNFFFITQYSRVPCFDCVQKHLGMAYIKGCESLMGYPQHYTLSIANMQEAYQQCPFQCQELRQTILFCIAKSKMENKIFLPIEALLRLLDMHRMNSDNPEATRQNKIDTGFPLQIDIKIKNELSVIPMSYKRQLIDILQKLIEIQYTQNLDRSLKVTWQGYMSTLSDLLLPFSSTCSNVLRNRRLMFRYTIDLVRNSDYDNSDILKVLKL